MGSKITRVATLLFAFATASFAADYPKATGQVNDTVQALPEFMVVNLERFAESFSENQHLNLVVLVMGLPEEVSCATAKDPPYAKKVLDSWGDDGRKTGDRGTVLLIVYTSGHTPEIEANRELEHLITLELKKKIAQVAAKPMQDKNMPHVVVQSLNALVDVLMNKREESYQARVRR